MEARRTPTGRRKADRRDTGREAARRNGRWPRESRKAGSRVGIEFRKELAAGAGGSFRQKTGRVTEWRLPWSRRTRPGLGLSDTTLARRRRFASDVAPRSTGGFGRTVTRGCVASGPMFCPPRSERDGAATSARVRLRRQRRRRPQRGRPDPLPDLAGQFALYQFQIIGMRDADAAPGGRQHGEGTGGERIGDDFG